MVVPVVLLAAGVASVAAFGFSVPLVSVAAASVLAGVFAMGLSRAASTDDGALDELRVFRMDKQRERVVHEDELPISAEDPAFALRVRRASVHWPLTELDPIERATFAGAVAQARDFDDLDVPWQELIIAAESGGRPHLREVLELRRET